jgi:anaerobic ribonucleoside-triphosphate reductase
MQASNGDHYFRFENCSGNVNLAGLEEACKALVGKSVDNTKAQEILKETVTELGEFAARLSKRHSRRLALTILPDAEASKRLVELDIERYGFAKVKFCGTRENPYYPTVERVAFSDGNVSADSLVKDQVLESGVTGISLVDLGDAEHDQGRLFDLTEKIATTETAVLLAYDRCFSYCMSCRKTWFGRLPKCPSCGSVGNLIKIDHFGSV